MASTLPYSSCASYPAGTCRLHGTARQGPEPCCRKARSWSTPARRWRAEQASSGSASFSAGGPSPAACLSEGYHTFRRPDKGQRQGAGGVPVPRR